MYIFHLFPLLILVTLKSMSTNGLCINWMNGYIEHALELPGLCKFNTLNDHLDQSEAYGIS